MEKGKSSDTGAVHSQKAILRLTSLLTPVKLRVDSSKGYSPALELYMVVMIMKYTGVRVIQALRLKHSDIYDSCHVYFKGIKKGRDRIRIVPSFIVSMLLAYRPYLSEIFSINYKYVYSNLRRLFNREFFIKGLCHFSICQTFRKLAIRERYQDYKNNINSICHEFGYKSKQSIAYYL